MSGTAPKKEPTRKLTPADAQAAYIDNFGLKISVDAKLVRDHFCTAQNLSSKSSKHDAVERYKRNPRIKRSSFFAADERLLVAKANSAAKAARVFKGSQQMAVPSKWSAAQST